MDASYWQDVFTTALGVVRRWDTEQERTLAILTALGEFYGRLRLLGSGSDAAQEEALAALRGHPATLPLLRAKHVRGLENLMVALRLSCEQFGALQAELSQLHARVWERHAKCADQLGPGHAASAEWGLVGAGRGLEAQRVRLPSPLLCVEWVQELDTSFSREALLKMQLVDTISCDMPPERLSHVHRAWSLQPNRSPSAVGRLQAIATSLTLSPPPDD